VVVIHTPNVHCIVCCIRLISSGIFVVPRKAFLRCVFITRQPCKLMWRLLDFVSFRGCPVHSLSHLLDLRLGFHCLDTNFSKGVSYFYIAVRTGYQSFRSLPWCSLFSFPTHVMRIKQESSCAIQFKRHALNTSWTVCTCASASSGVWNIATKEWKSYIAEIWSALLILFDLLKNAVCIPCPINNTFE